MQNPTAPSFPGGRGGRFPPGVAPPPGGRSPGRGRGMGHSQGYQGPGGGQAGMGMGVLGRAYQNANHTVEQLLPQLQTQAYLVQSQVRILRFSFFLVARSEVTNTPACAGMPLWYETAFGIRNLGKDGCYHNSPCGKLAIWVHFPAGHL